MELREPYGWCRERGVFARDLAQLRQEFCTGGSSESRREKAAELRELKQAHAEQQPGLNRKGPGAGGSGGPTGLSRGLRLGNSLSN